MALPLDPLRVLAVAADDAHHAPIRALLKGAQIDHVMTGDEAHQAVAANRYDVIMVDREIGPHGVDGLDLATELVGTPAPVIVLAHRRDRAADARAAEAGIADFYDAGVNTYIVKPVTFLALVRLMKVFTAYWLETSELPPGQSE